MTTTRKTASRTPAATGTGGREMRVTALRICMLACVVTTASLITGAMPLVWTAAALIVVGVVGIVVALAELAL